MKFINNVIFKQANFIFFVVVLYSGDDTGLKEIENNFQNLKIYTENNEDNTLKNIENILNNLGREQTKNKKNNQNFLFKSNKNFGKNSNESLNFKEEAAKTSKWYIEENKKIQKEQGEAENGCGYKKRKIPTFIAEEKEKIKEQEEIRRKKEEKENNEDYILKLKIQEFIREKERVEGKRISNAERLIIYGNRKLKQLRIGDKN